MMMHHTAKLFSDHGDNVLIDGILVERPELIRIMKMLRAYYRLTPAWPRIRGVISKRGGAGEAYFQIVFRIFNYPPTLSFIDSVGLDHIVFSHRD